MRPEVPATTAKQNCATWLLISLPLLLFVTLTLATVLQLPWIMPLVFAPYGLFRLGQWLRLRQETWRIERTRRRLIALWRRNEGITS